MFFERGFLGLGGSFKEINFGVLVLGIEVRVCVCVRYFCYVLVEK